MSVVRIVTDSSAQFLDPNVVSRHAVTVLPLSVQFGPQTCYSDPELDAQQFIVRLASDPQAPTLAAPTRADFVRAYQRLGEDTDQILSAHISARLTDTFNNARAAARELMGSVEIAVIDSRTTSVGLGFLVEELARAAEAGSGLGDLVRISHGLIPRIYGVFFVESLDYLEHSGRVGPAQAMLGTMLDIKPILTLEDGEILPMEKVRTRAQGIEKLIEFVGEFTALERLTVLHSHPNGAAETRLLLDRLSAEFPSVACPTLVFSPSLAAQIGPYSLGVIVFEGDEEEADH